VDDERDYWQEYKDDVAMGYINEDGSPREPDPDDYAEREADQRHLDQVHDGGACDCPAWEFCPWLTDTHGCSLRAGHTGDHEPVELAAGPPF
jgi:hypothetical protein